jgi:hypothetical protein
MRVLRLALLGAALLAGAPALAQPSGQSGTATPAAPTAPKVVIAPEGRALARDIIQLSGGAKQAEQGMTLAAQALSAPLAQMSGKQSAEVLSILNDVLIPEMRSRLPELLEIIAEAWAAHLTVDDLRQIKAFYESPIGQRLVEVQPMVIQQSILASQQWSQAVALDALQKNRDTLRQRGLKL